MDMLGRDVKEFFGFKCVLLEESERSGRKRIHNSFLYVILITPNWSSLIHSERERDSDSWTIRNSREKKRRRHYDGGVKNMRKALKCKF